MGSQLRQGTANQAGQNDTDNRRRDPSESEHPPVHRRHARQASRCAQRPDSADHAHPGEPGTEVRGAGYRIRTTAGCAQHREPLETHEVGDAGDIVGIVQQGSPGIGIGSAIPGTVNRDHADPLLRRGLRHGGIHQPGPGHAVQRDHRHTLPGAEHGHADPPTITQDQNIRVRRSWLLLLSRRHRATPSAPGQRAAEQVPSPMLSRAMTSVCMPAPS
jgi:hypothetical protein